MKADREQAINVGIDTNGVFLSHSVTEELCEVSVEAQISSNLKVWEEFPGELENVGGRKLARFPTGSHGFVRLVIRP